MEKNIVTVDIYTDIACPWCYVGEHKFSIARQRFLEDNPNSVVRVTLHPYMIDPNTKKSGEEYLAYNKRRWGGDGWTYSLREAGKKVGCHFASWKTWPNTFLAHCLVNYAGGKEKAGEVLNEIFELCYEKGENVSEMAVLERVAEKFNVDDGWKSKEVQKRVVEGDNNAKEEMDIHGVPYFIINGKYSLEGAVDPSSFIKLFSK